MRDPRYCNFFLDANSLDRKNQCQSDTVDRFLRICRQLDINPTKSYGVQTEIQHSRTPDAVRMDMNGIYTIKTSLTQNENPMKSRIRILMTGNAKTDKHTADADHLFEAQKYGGGFFITHDDRIRTKQREIQNTLECALRIVTLLEFVEFCET